jgi:hypothetical protein
MRMPSRPTRPGAVATLLALALATAACADNDATTGDTAATDTAAALPALEVTAEPQDSVIFEEKIAWARANGLDTMAIGDAIAALGRTFVGTTYTPATLELEGDERLIVNLRELDCVTFIENVLAITHVLRAGSPDYDSFKRALVRIRYRNGELDGYPSRLHYFSEWIANNEEKGIVEDITQDIGGVQDSMPLTFMTRNATAYRQLADSAVARDIAAIEQRLATRPRFYIAEDRIATVASSIRDGDIIAATSTLDGLDIAHTGFALWVDGELHLMHAPLVGSVVEISEQPLATRIQRIEAQDGIMVARPRQP